MQDSYFRRFYLRLLDSCVASSNLPVFQVLASSPAAIDLVLHPLRSIPHERFRSKLNLYYTTYEYKENVNETFIKNSLLYMAVMKGASLEMIKALVGIGCPIMNEQLEPGSHVRHRQNYHIGQQVLAGAYKKELQFEVLDYITDLLLLKAPAHAQYYSELAILIDLMTDKFIATKTFKRCTPFSPFVLTIIRKVLASGVLFARCYNFSKGRELFWAKKTGLLINFLYAMGLADELKETLDQLYRQLGTIDPTVEDSIVKNVNLNLIYNPHARPGVTAESLLSCLVLLWTSFDMSRCRDDAVSKLSERMRGMLGYCSSQNNRDYWLMKELTEHTEGCVKLSALVVLARIPDRLEDARRLMTLKPTLLTLHEKRPKNLKHIYHQHNPWPCSALEVACAYANSAFVSLLLSFQPELPVEVYSRALVKSLCGYYPAPSLYATQTVVPAEEIQVRSEIAKMIVEHCANNDRTDDEYLALCEPGIPKHRFRYALIAAAAFYPSEFVEWLISKGLNPHAKFEYKHCPHVPLRVDVARQSRKATLRKREAQRKLEKVVTPSVLREALLFNTDETVAVVIAALKGGVEDESLNECLFLAARRGLWSVVKDLIQDKDCSNTFVLKEVLIDLARDNRGDLLPYFLKPGKSVDVSYAVSRAILNRNIDFLFQLVKFYQCIVINLSAFTTVSFSPDLEPIVQLCCQLLMPKALSDRATPLHVLSRMGISALASVILSNSEGLLINELKGEEPIAIAAASGFSQVVDVYLDYLAAAQCDVSQYVKKALCAAILGKWGSQYNIKVPHYIPQAVFTSQVPLRYHRHFGSGLYKAKFEEWAKTHQTQKGSLHPDVCSVKERHYRDSADVIAEYKVRLEAVRTYNESVEKNQQGSEGFNLFQTKRMNVTQGIPAMHMPPSTYHCPHALFKASPFSEEEEVVFPSLQQNLDETIVSLVTQLSAQTLAASSDLLSIAGFYGEKLVLEKLSIGNLSTGVLLRLLTQMLNGYIYIFSPLFCSFYQSTWARHTFTIPCNYPSPAARLEHKRWWLHFMEELGKAAGASTLEEGESPSELRMSYLHIFYSCLHYLLLPVVVPLYPLTEKLGIDRSLYSVILLTAARYSDLENVQALINMGASPNWSHTIPSWVSVPRYDARDEAFERESESLGPWSDSESSLLSSGVEKADVNSSRQLPSALHWACENQHLEMAQFLLANRAIKMQQVPLSLLKPQPQQSSFKTLQVTPLDVACLHGNWSLIQLLRGEDELTAKHFSLILKSGRVEAFRAAFLVVPNALSIVREKRFLLRAVKHGKRQLAQEILRVYQANALTGEIAGIRANRETILHYCALNGMKEFAGELRACVSEEGWTQMCRSQNSYDFTPFLLARLVSRMDTATIEDDSLTDWAASVVSKVALCSHIFNSKVQCPGARYNPDTNEILRSSPLFSQLYCSLACGNARVTQELLAATPLFARVLSHFETQVSKPAGMVARLLFERAIKSGDLGSFKQLQALELPLDPTLLLYACKYARDKIGAQLLDSLEPPSDQLVSVAQEACRSGCIEVLSRIMSVAPKVFVTRMVHSPLEMAMVSGKPELFIMITQHCLATGLVTADQLLTYLKLEDDSPLDYLKAMSDFLRQKVMLELGVTGLLGENPWTRVMEAYREDPSGRMLCRDKLLLHIAGAAGLHKAVGALREYLSASVQPALPRAKQEALVEALKITREEGNPELVCRAEGVTIYLRPDVLETLPGEGWAQLFALVNLFSSSGILGVYEALRQSSPAFTVEVSIERKSPLSISYPEATRAVLVTSPVSISEPSDHPLFGSVQSLYIPIIKPEFPLQQTQELDSNVSAYMSSLSAVSKRIGIEGLSVAFDRESVPLEDLPTVLREFANAKSDWTSCAACGLTGMLLRMRDLMKEENSYYGRFTYDIGVEHEEEASPAAGPPAFFRSASTRLRLSYSEPAEDLVKHFEKIAVDGLQVKMQQVPLTSLLATATSEDWLFSVEGDSVRSCNFTFRPYAELKLKTVSHRLLSLFKFEMEQFKRNVEFNIPSLLDGVGIPISRAAMELGFDSPLLSPMHVVQLFLSSFRTQRWTHTLVRICMQHFYIVEESRAILIEAVPHVVSEAFAVGQVIDRVARIQRASYKFNGKFLCIQLHIAICDTAALSALQKSQSQPAADSLDCSKIDFTGFPVYSHEKVVFLEQLLSKELIIEEELKKISIQHMLDLHNQTLSEELGVEMQVSVYWQSLVEEVKSRMKLMCSEDGDIHQKGWEFQLIGELSMRLESRDFWMQLAHEYTTIDWDDLISLKMNCGQYPTFILGQDFRPRESSFGKLAINGFHDPGLKRSYLLNIDPQNLDMMNVDKCRVLLFTRDEKFVCELQVYESDQLTVLRGKRVVQVLLKNILQCYLVFSKYPTEEQLRYSKGPVLVTDSVGRVWKARNVVLPKYIKKEGLYGEALCIPSWGELTRPFATNPTLNFSQVEDGIRGKLGSTLTPSVEKAAICALPKCYLFLDTELEECKTTLNRRFKRLREWAHAPSWQMVLMYRVASDAMMPLSKIFTVYAQAARERLLYIFESLMGAIEGIVLCRKSIKSYSQPLFTESLSSPGSVLSHQVATLLQSYIKEVTVLLSFDSEPSVLEMSNGGLTIKAAFTTLEMIDDLSTDSIAQFLVTEVLKRELKAPRKATSAVTSRLTTDKLDSQFSLEDLMLVSVFPLLFVSCQHAATVCGLSTLTIDVAFNAETRPRTYEVAAEGSTATLTVFSNSQSTVLAPSFYRVLTDIYHCLHPADQSESKVRFTPRDRLSVLATKGQVALEMQGEALDPSAVRCLVVDWESPDASITPEVQVFDSILNIRLPDTPRKLRLLVFYRDRLKYSTSVEVNGATFSELYNVQPQYAVFTPIAFLVDLLSSRRVRYSIPTHFTSADSVTVCSFPFAALTVYSMTPQAESANAKELANVRCWQVTERYALVQFESCSMQRKYICAVSSRTGFLLKLFKTAYAPGPSSYNELKLELTCRLKTTQTDAQGSSLSLTPAKRFALEPAKPYTRYALFAEGLLFEFREGLPDSQSARVVSKSSLTSIAGQLRHDWIEARDKLENKIVEGEWRFTAEFRHVSEGFRYQAEVVNRENGLYELTWTPLRRGKYALFIDGKKVPKTKPFVIDNAKICPENCVILADKSCFIGEKNVFHIRLRDAYENIYTPSSSGDSQGKFGGELQINDEFRLTASFLSPDEELPCTLYPVDQRGLVKVEGVIEFKEWLKLKVEINEQSVKNSPFPLRLQPMRYQTKHKKFMKACRALPGYKTEQNVSVNRTEFLQELLTNFSLAEPRGTLWVKWKNEPGYDAGGLRREFFDKLSREIVKSESHVFRQQGGYVKPDPLAGKHHSDVHRLFSVVGMLCARAAIHQILLDIAFAPSIYKTLLGKTLVPADLKDDDPELWASIEGIRKLEPDVLLSTDLNFTVTQYDQSVAELCENGANIPVTAENREDYIAMRALWHIHTSVQPMLDAFREGFHEAVPLRILSIFESEELPKVINGSTEFSVAFLKKRTKYELCNTQTREIRWLWNWLESASEQVIKGFLRFTTGSARIPFNDRHWFLTVNRTFGSDVLPRASTCSNTIYIPLYGTYKQMAKFMTIAVLEGSEGFGDT